MGRTSNRFICRWCRRPSTSTSPLVESKTFQQLYATVTSGQYAKPWLAGVEHVTRDHQGYVYWKGSRIEHFTFSVMREDHLKCHDSTAG